MFIPNKSFSQLLDISPKALYFQKYIYICKMLWIFFLAKNMGKNIDKNISKNVSSIYVQKPS